MVVHLSVLLLIVLLGTLPTFTHGEHIKLLRDQCQALLFLLGCLTVTFGLIIAVTDDIRRGAGPILMSRPIGSTCLLAGKWTGVMIAMMLLHVSGLAAYLWTSEIAWHSEFLNTGSLVMYLLLVLGACAAGAVRHYLFGSSFTRFTNFALVVVVVAGLVIRLAMRGGGVFDWYGLQAGLMLMPALITFAAVMLPVAVAVDSAMVMIAGALLFFTGLISEAMISSGLVHGVIYTLIKALVPNWQIYWMADWLAQGKTVPASYAISCAVHATAFAALCGAVAILIIDKSEVKYA